MGSGGGKGRSEGPRDRGDSRSRDREEQKDLRPGARAIALDILVRFESGEGLLDMLLAKGLSSAHWLDRRNRAFVNALVQGVVRHRTRLDWIIAQLSRTPLEKVETRVLCAMRLGAFQVVDMTGVPPSAAVNTTVELLKPGHDFIINYVNGLMRSLTREAENVTLPDMADDPVKAIAVAESYPEWLVQRWVDRMGVDRALELCRAGNQIAPITVRANTLACAPGELQKTLGRNVEGLARGRLAPLAFTFTRPELPIATMDAHKKGWFAVQDEAAQLVCLLASPKAGESVLDACAGRGGKTGYLAQLLDNKGYLCAADEDTRKLEQLEREMNRLGAMVGRSLMWDATRPPPRQWRDAFDCVVVDAPCTGLGVVRKHPDAKWLRDKDSVTEKARLQTRILRAAAQAVKPGGRLVYSVCSMEPEEGEAVVGHFLTRNDEFGLIPAGDILDGQAKNAATPEGWLKTSPAEHGCDGFFAACLQRKDFAQ